MFDHVVGTVGVIIGLAGLAFSGWLYHQKRNTEKMVFGFLRGVKVSAEGNANNTGDTSVIWKALITQIDDINRRLE